MNSYRKKKERERILISSAAVLGFILFVILISLILNLFKFEDFNEYTGPVKITFGTPEGLDELLKTPEITKPQNVEPKPVPKPEVEPEPEITEIRPDTVPEPVENKPEEPKVEEPVESYKEPAEESIPEPKPVVQKGVENGNSHETSFESSSSKIGRRAYFPIWQFMPLPGKISKTIYSQIHGDITRMDEENYNRNLFLMFYSESDDQYKLKDTVPLQSRPDLWAILEQAGYDMDNAEYKKGRNLKSVIISFEINSNSNGINAIKSAEIDSSSGYGEIDEAVLYGFRQSTYSNSTDDSVKGRFKYSFK